MYQRNIRLQHQGDKNRWASNISSNQQPKHTAKKDYVRKEALELDAAKESIRAFRIQKKSDTINNRSEQKNVL
jgi:hypothetical protein